VAGRAARIKTAVPRSKTLWQLKKRELEMSLGDRGEGGDGRREGRGPHSDDREARGPDPRVKHLDAAGGGADAHWDQEVGCRV